MLELFWMWLVQGLGEAAGDAPTGERGTGFDPDG